MREAAARGEPFDVAILDYHMPHMDGLAVARTITSDPLLRRSRLILLTSIGVRGEAEQAKQAGVSAYLTKPIHRGHLYDCLCQLVNRPSETSAGVPGELVQTSTQEVLLTRHVLKEVTSASRPRILVAEDNIVNQKVAVGQLDKLGYRVDVVTTGREAVEAVARVDYALVFMDCLMPDMDGFEATAWIRKAESNRGQRLPIIAMTANAMPEDHQRCVAAGMDDYLSKPVKQADIIRMLQRWLPGPTSVVG
jgi:CheY-like chemotaxis protein